MPKYNYEHYICKNKQGGGVGLPIIKSIAYSQRSNLVKIQVGQL